MGRRNITNRDLFNKIEELEEEIEKIKDKVNQPSTVIIPYPYYPPMAPYYPPYYPTITYSITDNISGTV